MSKRKGKLQPWQQPLRISMPGEALTKDQYDALVKVNDRPLNWSPTHRQRNVTHEQPRALPGKTPS